MTFPTDTKSNRLLTVFLLATILALGNNAVFYHSFARKETLHDLTEVPPPKREHSLDADPDAELPNEYTTTEKAPQPELPHTVQLPLQPPFHIVQFGYPRSGSTFQAQLLIAIVELKSLSSTSSMETKKMEPKYLMNSPDPDYRNKTKLERTKNQPNSESYRGKEYFAEAMVHGFVLKTHKDAWVRKLLNETETNGDENIAIFLSLGDRVPEKWSPTNASELEVYGSSRVVLRQSLSDLTNCSLCEIEKYRSIFGLSDADVELLREFMSKYQVIRRCCGFQMSKYERLRLHGCDVAKYQDRSDYPWCENENLMQAEFDLGSSSGSIRYHSGEEEIGNSIEKMQWAQPGDCAYFQNEVRNGKDFNGRAWDPALGCDLESVSGVSSIANRLKKEKRNEENLRNKELRREQALIEQFRKKAKK